MSTCALFQLGMDLDRGSSTAQTEDTTFACGAAVAHDDRKDYFIERDGVRYAGTHLIIDLMGAERLDDLEHIEETLRTCVAEAGATLIIITHDPELAARCDRIVTIADGLIATDSAAA